MDPWTPLWNAMNEWQSTTRTLRDHTGKKGKCGNSFVGSWRFWPDRKILFIIRLHFSCRHLLRASVDLTSATGSRLHTMRMFWPHARLLRPGSISKAIFQRLAHLSQITPANFLFCDCGLVAAWSHQFRTLLPVFKYGSLSWDYRFGAYWVIKHIEYDVVDLHLHTRLVLYKGSTFRVFPSYKWV